MRSIAATLFRRRSLWLPTRWGWLVLLLVLGGTGWAAGRQAHRWLSVDAPVVGADGQRARTLVVEGWLDPFELDRAAEVFGQGRYERIVTTGGRNDGWPESRTPSTYADRAADYLKRHGVPASRVISAPAPASVQDRTYLSAVAVREWAARTGTRVDALDVFSGGTHARRSRMLYRLAFGPGVAVGALSAPPVAYDPARWWVSSAGVKSVLGELLSNAWTVCCFWPPAAPPVTNGPVLAGSPTSP